MKRLVIASLLALLALALLLLTSLEAGAEEIACPGFLGAVTVDNLLVPQNASCTLDGTRVEGTIKVENGASLTATQVTVIGNVQAEGAEVVNVLAGSTVSGSIQIKHGAAAEVDEVHVNGDIQFESNERGLSATRNQVGGNVQAFQNTGGVTIANNVIDGNLQCTENDPAPTGGNNVVHGNKEDQCAYPSDAGSHFVFLPALRLFPDCGAPVTVLADADSWIDQNSSSNNFGSDAILKVRSQGPGDNFRALVRFALPTSVPAGCVVQSATLRLYSPSWTMDRTLEALQIAADWSENTVTWSNQPATTGAAATTASDFGYREWEVTAQVQAIYDTGVNHGFLIRDATEGGGGAEQQFHSREKGENPPMLVVSFAPVAPPDTTPPETAIDSGPDATTTSTSATFTFSSSEPDSTFECSLDGAAFAACASPHEVTELAVGAHTFEVQATDPAGNVDATPASWTWIVEAAVDCGAPVTVLADADSWIDQNSSSNNFGSDAILKVRSQGPGDNFRALVRFALPTSVPAGCVVQSATLRLYAASATTGRTLEAVRVADAWSEGLVTWSNQPATTGAAATTASDFGYREWEVASQVQGMYDTGANHGFLIRDVVEGESGGEQQFHSREKGENPPMLVVSFAPGP